MNYKVIVISGGRAHPAQIVSSMDEALLLSRGGYPWAEIQRFIAVHCDGDLHTTVTETFKGDSVFSTIREIK